MYRLIIKAVAVVAAMAALCAVYGSEKGAGTFTDARDGKQYRTVKIGNRTWMAENLNYDAPDKYGVSKDVCYDDNADNCEKYGRLYSWTAAADACPAGWRLPSEAEWQTLANYAGGEKTAGKKLRSETGWNGNLNGTNEHGFSALPGGFGYDLNSNSRKNIFVNAGSYSIWWGSTVAKYGKYAWSRSVGFDDGESMGRHESKKETGRGGLLFSVRCVQELSYAPIEFVDSRDKKTYKKVTIGDQTWMAENLSYDAADSKCYDSKPENCAKYGGLYTWDAAMKACPAGWHLPSDAEWQTLVYYAGGEETAFTNLMSPTGWDSRDTGTNKYGFSALPGYYDGALNRNSAGYWWTATEDDEYYAWRRFITLKEVIGKTQMFSVRCVEGGSNAGGSIVKAKNVNSLEMAPVKGGTFTMGCTAEQGDDCDGNAKPAHSVTLSDFSIGKYEVTQALWIEIMGNNPSKYIGAKLPVEQVSMDDVQEFISKLNAKTGKKYRLPTEAEWEYAARGGNTSKGYRYSGGNNINDVAWHIENSGRTKSVGSKKPNELGIYDMSGNVREWVNDKYGPYSAEAQTDPTGPNPIAGRVTRGGCSQTGEWNSRVSCRYKSPNTGSSNIGFRLAESP